MEAESPFDASLAFGSRELDVLAASLAREVHGSRGSARGSRGGGGRGGSVCCPRSRRGCPGATSRGACGRGGGARAAFAFCPLSGINLPRHFDVGGKRGGGRENGDHGLAN